MTISRCGYYSAHLVADGDSCDGRGVGVDPYEGRGGLDREEGQHSAAAPAEDVLSIPPHARARLSGAPNDQLGEALRYGVNVNHSTLVAGSQGLSVRTELDAADRGVRELMFCDLLQGLDIPETDTPVHAP